MRFWIICSGESAGEKRGACTAEEYAALCAGRLERAALELSLIHI